MTLDNEAAIAARDEGIQAAIDHADAIEPDWAIRAFNAFAAYAQENCAFTTEDVRAASGLEAPADNRAWGAVALKAKRAGLIAHHGWTEARDPRVHCNVIRVWASLVCGKVAA